MYTKYIGIQFATAKLKIGVKRISTKSLKIGFGSQVVITMTTLIYTLGTTIGTPCLF
jgi:hypothetical protein